MSLHPDIEALLDLVEAGTASGKRVPLHELGPQRARVDFDASSPLLDVAPAPLACVSDMTVPAADGAELAARLYAPRQPDPAAPMPVLLYLHGGGFTVGGLDSHAPLCRALARDADCAVLALAYRLAPEHKFPTAFLDALAAWRWLAACGAAAGLDANRAAVGGDSAGGTLSAALSLALRDEPGLPQPRLQLLAYPGLSARQEYPSYTRFGSGHLLEADTIQWFYAQYLRDDADRDDWRFAPLAASDLAGAAPACIVLPEYDPLVDEGVAYAERLRAAGVPVSLRIFPGMVHEFLRMGNVVDAAEEGQRHLAAALREALA